MHILVLREIADLTRFFLFQINHAITLRTEARGIKSRFVTENKLVP